MKNKKTRNLARMTRLLIPRNRSAAMEMSVGTIVTIVLLMSVLILGIFLIQRIFGVAKGAIDLTEEQLNNKLKALYETDENQRIILFPEAGIIEIKKGKSDGLGLLINNRLETEESFSYEITLADKGTCAMTEEQIMSLITLGKEREGVELASGSILSHPLRINFAIPETAKLCQVLYRIEVSTSDKTPYDGADIQLTIE